MTIQVRVETMTLPTCSGVKKDGQPCKFRGRYDGRCGFHAPKELRDCPICYEKILAKDSKVTSCKHEFHSSCLERWTKEHSTCPMCRELIAPKPPPKTTTVRIEPFWFVMNGRTYNFSESVYHI